MCMCTHECRYPRWPEMSDHAEAGVTGGSESPDIILGTELGSCGRAVFALNW